MVGGLTLLEEVEICAANGFLLFFFFSSASGSSARRVLPLHTRTVSAEPKSEKETVRVIPRRAKSEEKEEKSPESIEKGKIRE